VARSLLSLWDLDSEDVVAVLARISRYKKAIRSRAGIHDLNHRVFGLLFEKPSTRTRTGFETAVLRMGGNALYLQSDHLQASRGEPIKDTARVLGSYLDGIIARVYAHDSLHQLQKFAGIPVINGLSDLEHPTQVLSDLFTIREEKGELAGLTLAYIGDGNNVCNSLLIGAALTGMHMRVACPKGYEPDSEVLRKARGISRESSSHLTITREPKEAAVDADILYTDTWISMGDEKEQEKRLLQFQGYQINADLIAVAAPEARVMHCLPAHRGFEITDEALEGPQSIVWPQAENKLHGAAGILGFLYAGEA
jgi:ornithine carbamoyltransferase (EC 2.1.3.3)